MTDIPTTRTRIIAEATRLFAAQGIKATTVAQIEDAVGLRKGSGGVHRYFATKDDLVSAVLEAQLDAGAASVEATGAALPVPSPEASGTYLRALGALVLSEADKNRDVALIMLRDAQALAGRLDDHRRRNDAMAYGATATAVREIQERLHDSLGLDADAYGYVFLAPLIYFKLIEWATGRHPLDVRNDALVETWATVMEPTFRHLAEAAQTPVPPPTRAPPTRKARRSRRNGTPLGSIAESEEPQ